MRDITEIIVHCSATKQNRPVTVQEITAWHKARGFVTIGYHYFIDLEGNIHPGRPEQSIGAHCLGHNKNSIGICYAGGLDLNGNPKDTRTQSQKQAMLTLLRNLKKRYPGARIRSHRDFAAKGCPCFDATAEYKDL